MYVYDFQATRIENKLQKKGSPVLEIREIKPFYDFFIFG